MVDQSETDLNIPRLCGRVEVGCWTMLAMTPIIWWLQGPSVSTDQFAVRIGLVVVSAITGSGLRAWAWFNVRRSVEKPQTADATPECDR